MEMQRAADCRMGWGHDIEVFPKSVDAARKPCNLNWLSLRHDFSGNRQ